MYKVLVLAGGTSDEREVSLRSGQAVAEGLRANDYKVRVYDPADGTEELLMHAQHADVIFPALHGMGGEDGSVQQLLEEHDIPCVGSDSVASKLCFDKWQYKQLLIAHNIRTPEGAIVAAETLWDHPLSQQPFVLKPFDGGSSIDTFIVRNAVQAPKEKITEAFSRHPSMLLEELIEGIESSVAVLGEQALPMIEIIPPSDEEFDYENKYNGKTSELCPPEHIPENLQHEGQELAFKIHRLTGCAGMSRTDIMISPEGMLYILETNTIPGLTDQSLLPKAAATAGIDMPKLTALLVEDALARRQ